MWLILQHDKPDDYVLSTNEFHSVREFLEKAFGLKGFNIKWKGEGVNEIGYDDKTGRELIFISERYFRPAEVEELLGDSTKARTMLGWKPKYSFDDLDVSYSYMEIIKERLEREFNLVLIATSPTVVYQVVQTNGEKIVVDNPSSLPERSKIESIIEPFVNISLHTPKRFLGGLLELCESRRGVQKNINFISEDRLILEYELPLSEMIYDFYNRVKSITKGYCSMDYEPSKSKESDLVKLDILINAEIVDALSIIIHKENSYYRGRDITEKLKEIIPRQQFEVAIQAAIGAKIIARETVKAFRKDVTAKLYGGDVTRKNKLLDKQKKGKKRMKNVGSVEIPQEAFMAVLTSKE